jgi:hypothetical protein
MSLRPVCFVVLAALVACAGARPSSDEPTTAREKQKQEARNDKDASDDPPPGSKKWSGWRYKGDRNECFYLFGAKCFKTEKAACQAAGCKAASKKCHAEGGGPATVSCR